MLSLPSTRLHLEEPHFPVYNPPYYWCVLNIADKVEVDGQLFQGLTDTHLRVSGITNEEFEGNGHSNFGVKIHARLVVL